MQTIKPILPFFLVLIISIALIVWLFPTAHPYGGIRLSLDDESVVQHSRSILQELGIDNAGLNASLQFQTNRPLLRQVQRQFGLQRANLLLRDSVPAYYWNVRWSKDRPLNFSFGNSGSDSKQVEEIADILRGDISFHFDSRGMVLEFLRKIPDSTKLPSLTQKDAIILASTFLRKYTAIGKILGDTIAPLSQNKIEKPYRSDYEFVWGATSPVPGNRVQAKVTVAGNVIAKFESEDGVPAEFARGDSDSFLQIAIILFYIATGIAMLIIAFKRFRSFEIGFRLAIIAGILVGVLTDVELFLTIRNEMRWEILIPLIFAPLFTGGGLILVWAVCESVVREAWKEKFISLDLLSKGHFFHSHIGKNVVRGMVLGVAGFALWLILVRIGGETTHLWTTHSDDNPIHTFDLSLPWLYVLGHGIYANAYVFAFCVLFVMSALRKYISNATLLVVLGSIALGFMSFHNLHPFPVALTVSVLASAVPIWTFYRFDALAAFLTLTTFTIVQETAGLIVVANPGYAAAGTVLIVLGCIALVVSVATMYRKNEIRDFEEITPAFARHITERQRLQQELEIARSVQMSFLPKANPITSKFDIASRCAPALEVGGDYYDFINLNDQRLGVAVGDVSGKGTQAAFFMTLTKGFLNALAHVSNSPSKILTQVNKLFYESVERGIFISMVYGIFDTRANSLTLARAGHNPVIMRKSLATDVQVVNPMGLALGLDQGDTFSKSIQEVTIDFQPGDLFVFYTDGFPEAMNKTMEEFGEERLCKTVEKYSSGSAAEIMEGVFRDMKEFTGKAKQHDDMTIVVVKVV